MSNYIKDIYFIHGKEKLIIRSNVICTFREYVEKNKCNEAGGILLGRIYDDYNEIIDITTPNRFDKWGRSFFVRSRKGAQPRINRSWKKSNGTLIYLGEWHTHFKIKPIPSYQDRNMIGNTLKITTMDIDFLYLIIVGLENTYWVGKQTSQRLFELTPQDLPI